MELNQTVKNWLLIIGTTMLAGIVIAFAVPWSQVNWGKFELMPASTITVSGQADDQVANQVARFNAGVTAVNDDRQTAVDEVNQTMESIIQSVKEFGIADENIQTQSINVHQEERFIEPERRSEPGQWRANNSISIKLEDIDRTQELADLLSASGATNVNGPNFGVEETNQAEAELMNLAIENAREKAQAIAEASGRRLGKVVSVTEGGSQGPVMPFAMESARGLGGGGVDTPVEPGSATISQSVTVTFELK